ncbi:YgiQ family radical SAM protein [Sulfurirhabdus autotrophica]|uniref:Putative radical SAM protein YgiQ n=1 Tax=Sulfurirhabdus autotrophica TaxID=1706046 RepID=A0A4R3Y6P4_9PROT|nr:YgiQ family radical SAM protein [Sulfurirhabdus autotrophica]TCV85893.1 putative radical SAM protein YgiQ [Sulfurirhabdus autotrophica]
MIQTPPPINSYRKYWAKRFGVAPVLPMSRAEMDKLGWDSCDIILVTGDAYIDHPSFGMALVGRLLEDQGFRVGIISQPDWQSAKAFAALGKPNLFYGVTAGNMDSMVNRYTSDRKLRSDDAYTPDGAGGKRPDRTVVVYSQRCREAYGGVPVIIGGIEASLRRIAQYDYWSDKVRRSVLPDSKADMLLFGNAERALVEVAHRLARGEAISDIKDVRGTAIMRNEVPEGWSEIDSSHLDTPGPVAPKLNPYDWDENKKDKACDQDNPKPPAESNVLPLQFQHRKVMKLDRATSVIRLPSYEQVGEDPVLYAHASRILHTESNPGNARALVQKHGKRDVWINPPPIPLTTPEMDHVYGLPYNRLPHPSYGNAKIPAYEMIRFSINIMRGCFGGCTFCSITEHEGRIIQSRSEESVLTEIEEIRDKVPGFTGIISDLGGPTANMYRLACKSPKIESACRLLSCVFPEVCSNLGTDHAPLIQLYRKARAIPGIKKILISSGLRYDLAVLNPEYVKELVTHHVGGYLKIAPEHIEEGPLSKMMKPGIGAYNKFKELFEKYSKEAGKEQYLIPYFIAAHPGTTDEDMLNLALWLKKNSFRLDQVQNFLPSPMALATAMYYSGKNPLCKVTRDSEAVKSPKSATTRRLHKAFLRYHDPNNWPLIRDALKNMGRSDLIGNGKQHLVPHWQPMGTGLAHEGARRPGADATRRTPHPATTRTITPTRKAPTRTSGKRKAEGRGR